ncbi:glycine betaine ABC transporter substrate-binding protein [Bacillus taeanensis]|uniref:Glycine/betaine ABC transporter n=1 Tax=Bacillus taeanensis TaxID=273032 RepID=A0A366XRF6_9BACI|nr:glycine betaine ABC transporter substrate-binding protein [Bacillus taeanensis]RBW68930.1 glycine/betaine ABC transporter [Bacillus taeanensis]
MFKNKFSFLALILMLSLSVVLAACGSNEEAGTEGNDNEETTASIGEQVDYEIVGIDPGAGLMKLADKALEEYELEDWKVTAGSGAAMTAALKKAYDDEEPIIVTGWTPHWKFSSFDLKYLEDPKGVFGGPEQVHTIVRPGLKEDLPGAYTVLDQFEWEPNNLEDVMLKIENGMDPEEAAAEWVSENEELVNTWTEGAEEGSGEVTFTYVAWSDVIAGTNVISHVLESLGYQTDLRQVEAAAMYAGVADGSADALVGAWLPTTHEDYMNEYGDQLEDLGPNLDGTTLGLVVPAYMDIDSIEDLK